MISRLARMFRHPSAYCRQTHIWSTSVCSVSLKLTHYSFVHITFRRNKNKNIFLWRTLNATDTPDHVFFSHKFIFRCFRGSHRIPEWNAMWLLCFSYNCVTEEFILFLCLPLSSSSSSLFMCHFCSSRFSHIFSFSFSSRFNYLTYILLF